MCINSSLCIVPCICHISTWWRMCQKQPSLSRVWLKQMTGDRQTYISHFINLLEAGLQEGLESSTVGEKPQWEKQAHKTRIYLTQPAKIESCFYYCNHTIKLMFTILIYITQNLLPCVEGYLSQCITGIHLLINVCIFHTKSAKTLRQMELECKQHIFVCSGVLPCNILDVCFCNIFQKIIHIFFLFIVIIIIIVQQNKGLILLKVCLKRGERTVDRITKKL